MKAILHIGTEKTGTTSIQSTLANNRDGLVARGIMYSSAAGTKTHASLAAFATGSKRIPDRLLRYGGGKSDPKNVANSLPDELAAEVEAAKAAGVHTIIYSSEHISSRVRSVDEARNLCELLTGYGLDPTVVIYLRRQDDYLESSYSTAVKTGETEPLRIPTGRRMTRRYDYQHILGVWAEAFGKERLVPRLFEKNSLRDQDVVNDFLSVAGVDEFSWLSRRNELNTRLSAAQLEFLRRLNERIPPQQGDKPNRLRRRLIVAMASRTASQDRFRLPDDIAREFMQNFVESNAWVASEYFGSTDPLFPARNGSGSNGEVKALSVDDAVEWTALLMTIDDYVKGAKSAERGKKRKEERLAARARRRATEG